MTTDTPSKRGRSKEETDVIIKNLTDRFNDTVLDHVRGSGWLDYLKLLQTSYRYSANNTLLIWSQRPTATMVRGYAAWKKAGRQVRKGAEGIFIYAPLMVRHNEEQPDGSTKKVSKRVGWKLSSVFDIADTEGPPVPELTYKQLDGAAPHDMWDSLSRRVEHHGYKLMLDRIGRPGVEGYTSPDSKLVVVSSELSPAQAAVCLAHENFHIELGHVDNLPAYLLHKNLPEIETESATWVLSNMYGLDSSVGSVPYVTGYMEKPEDVRAVAGRVMTAVRAVVDFTPELQYDREASDQTRGLDHVAAEVTR